MNAKELESLKEELDKKRESIQSLTEECRIGMKEAILSVCEELGGGVDLRNEVFDATEYENFCISYDGGNHPEYASDCFHDIYSFCAKRDKNGNAVVFAEIDETDEYEDCRMPFCDLVCLYDAAMFAYENKEEYLSVTE